jgi:hypothetical protein
MSERGASVLLDLDALERRLALAERVCAWAWPAVGFALLLGMLLGTSARFVEASPGLVADLVVFLLCVGGPIAVILLALWRARVAQALAHARREDAARRLIDPYLTSRTRAPT